MPPKLRQKTPLRPNQLLQPTLFDKLRDFSPNETTEAPEAFVMGRKQIQAIVQRDLSFLFNSINMGSALDDELFPDLVTSSFNYGLPPITGNLGLETELNSLKERIREAIITFEPRILPEGLQVEIQSAGDNVKNMLQITLEVSGRLYLHPYPLFFMLHAVVDSDQPRLVVKSLHVE